MNGKTGKWTNRDGVKGELAQEEPVQPRPLELVWDELEDDIHIPTPPDTLPSIRGAAQDRIAIMDEREQALLQVTMAAEEVVKDTDNIMHQETTHYLVEKDVIDALRGSLNRYKNANEDYIGSVDGTDATPSTKEM